MSSQTVLLGVLAALALGASGCASSNLRPPPPAAAASPQTTAPGAAGATTPATAAAAPAPESSPPAAAPAAPERSTAGAAAAPEATAAPAAATASARPRHSLRDLCRDHAPGEPENEAAIDEARRSLQETVCAANLWFDGLFGGRADVRNARAVSGVVEGSGIYSQAEGTDTKLRLRLNYDLPNLKNRLNLFLGRGDERELIEDRIEGLPVRSSIFGLEGRDDWLAGFGYSLPGRWESKIDFRVGARVKSASEIYVQGRYRRNFFVGESSVVRLRETLFWKNREDGFGGTTSIDFDHLLDRRKLLRFANVATLSQGTEGTRWRSSLLLYHNLNHSLALLYQVFVRGETGADVPLREYGAQAVFRMPFGRRWLFGSFTGGYTWPRIEREERRQGSALVGFGLELQFGEDPY
jgi:hypothetical protein